MTQNLGRHISKSVTTSKRTSPKDPSFQNLKKITGYVGVSIPQKEYAQKFPPSSRVLGFLGFSFSGFSCADASHICQVLEGHRGTEVRDPEHPSLVEYTPGKTNILKLRKYIHPRIPGETSTQTIKFLVFHVCFQGCITVAKLKVSLGIP